MRYFFYILSGIVTILLITLIYLFSSHKSLKEISVQQPKKDQLILKLAHNTPEDSALNEASIRFAKEVAKKSKGKIKVEVYPSQQLGNDYKTLELAREGKIDIVLMPTAKMSIAIPSMQYADLPFFFPAKEDLYAMLDSDPGMILLDKLKKVDLVGVTFWENGFKDFSANTPILTPKDFEGKKIRIMKSRIIQEQFKEFGAKPVVIDFYSTKKALQDGVVDGQENPLVAFYSMGFYEVQSDLTLSQHAYLGYVFSISAKTFEHLSHENREILIQTAKEITPWERARTQEKEDEILEKIKAHGVKVHTLTQAQREEFQEITSDLPQKYEDVIGPDLISKTQEMLLNRHPQKDIFTIGLDADFSTDEDYVGLGLKRGAQLAIDEINKRGGVLGKKLVLIAKDNKHMGTKGVDNIKEFLKRDDLMAILGGKNSNVINDEIPFIQQAKKPYIATWATASKLTENGYKENYIFRVSATNNSASTFIAKKAAERYKNIAIMAENTIFGKESVESVKKYLSSNVLKPSNIILFNRGQKNFSKEIDTLVNDGVDCVILAVNSKEASTIANKLYDRDKKIAIYSHWSILDGDFYKNMKGILKHMDFQLFETFSFAHNVNKTSQKLKKEYLKKYAKTDGEHITAQNAVAQAYDAVHILVKAIKKAKSSDGKKIKEALETLRDVQGSVKHYDHVFSKENHDALESDEYFMKKLN